MRVGSAAAKASGEVKGFTPDEIITCYAHVLVHVAHLIKCHGSLAPFSMQNLERQNNSDGSAWNSRCSRRRDEELKELLLRQARMVTINTSMRKTTLKPLQCSECHERFAKPGWLNKHMRKVHGKKICGEKLFKCELCNASFTANRSKTRHMMKQHNVGGGNVSLGMCF